MGLGVGVGTIIRRLFNSTLLMANRASVVKSASPEQTHIDSQYKILFTVACCILGTLVDSLVFRHYLYLTIGKRLKKFSISYFPMTHGHGNSHLLRVTNLICPLQFAQRCSWCTVTVHVYELGRTRVQSLYMFPGMFPPNCLEAAAGYLKICVREFSLQKQASVLSFGGDTSRKNAAAFAGQKEFAPSTNWGRVIK